MEDIRIYDFEFNLLYIEHDFKSSNWTIYFNDIGTWEGHFDVDSDIVPFAMNNPYLVVVQGKNQAIITSIQANSEFILYGRTPNWLLTRRAMQRFNTNNLSINKDVETIARYVVGQSFPELTLGKVTGFTNTDDFWRNTTNPTFDVVKECLDKDKAGHAVIFDRIQKKWVFQVLKGKTLDLIISEANNNAYDTEYNENLLNYYSGGWYERELSDQGEWDASTNSPTLTNNLPANFGKYYKVSIAGTRFNISFKVGDYIVCRNKTGAWEKSSNTDPVWERIEGDSTKQGLYKWDCVLSGTVESEAKSDLSKRLWEKELSTKTRDLKFGADADYYLGDTVRVQKKAGSFMATFQKRIVGVNIWYENNNMGEQPIFEG